MKIIEKQEKILKRIAFLLPNSTQPRFYKRVDELSKLKIQTNVLAFERKYFNNKNLKYSYHSLGYIRHGKYYQRIFPILKAMFVVRKITKDDDAIYAFGFDMLILSVLTNILSKKKRKIVYELGDIREQMIGKSYKAKFLRLFERLLLKKVFLVVVTSNAFVTEYFQRIQNLKSIRYHVIENKSQINTYPEKSISRDLNNKSVITIGYFGLLRCRASLELIQKVVNKGKGKYKAYIRGIPFGPVKDIDKFVADNPNIYYEGAYEAPGDLEEMYEKVDLVWACYPFSSEKVGNHLWARTNRFYEACYFKKPMFVHSYGEDSKSIREYNIGMELDLDNIDSAVEKILAINSVDVNEWKKNIESLPEKIYMYTNEHEEIFNELFEDEYSVIPPKLLNKSLGDLSDFKFLFITNTNWHNEPPRARHLLAKEILERNGEVHFVQRCNSACYKDDSFENLFLYSFPGNNLTRKISCLLPPFRIILDRTWNNFLCDVIINKEKKEKTIILNFRYDFPISAINKLIQSYYICNDEFIERQPWFARLILKPLEVKTAKFSDDVFVISNHLKKKFRNFGINSTLFFPGGQDFSGYKPFYKKIDFNSKIKLGYIGFINDRFDFKVIKELLDDSIFDISLIGPVEQKAKRKLNKLILSGVHYEGAKVGIEFVNSISKFDAVILPYKLTKATIGIEIPNKLFPALQTGRPIFISKLPNLYSFNEELITTIPLKQKQWTEIIKSKLKNETKEMFKKRIGFSKEYTWERALKIILLEEISLERKISGRN